MVYCIRLDLARLRLDASSCLALVYHGGHIRIVPRAGDILGDKDLNFSE